MKKHHPFKFLVALATLLWLLPNWSFAQNNEPRLSQEDQQNADLFKSLQGADRTHAFQRLQHLIQPVGLEQREPIPTAVIGANTTNEEELLFLLGEPTERIQKSLWRYELRGSSSTCRLDIGLNEDGYVTFIVIKDCQ